MKTKKLVVCLKEGTFTKRGTFMNNHRGKLFNQLIYFWIYLGIMATWHVWLKRRRFWIQFFVLKFEIVTKAQQYRIVSRNYTTYLYSIYECTRKYIRYCNNMDRFAIARGDGSYCKPLRSDIFMGVTSMIHR